MAALISRDSFNNSTETYTRTYTQPSDIEYLYRVNGIVAQFCQRGAYGWRPPLLAFTVTVRSVVDDVGGDGAVASVWRLTPAFPRQRDAVRRALSLTRRHRLARNFWARAFICYNITIVSATLHDVNKCYALTVVVSRNTCIRTGHVLSIFFWYIIRFAPKSIYTRIS